MSKVEKNKNKKNSVNTTSSNENAKKQNENSKEKVVKTPKTRKRIDKDALMNTPKEKDSGVKIMPHDEDTLRVFSLKKMNFKDMTNTQKTTLIVLLVFLGLFFMLWILPTLSKMFGGPNIGSLIFINKEQEEDDDQKENDFALEGDYIILGNNTYINVEGIKFYNFTKSSGYQLVYNYISSNNIEDVKALKIYVEFYNNTKTLINRFAFETETNTLTEGVQGIGQIEMSSNNFNKAYYVRVRVITDAVIDELPDQDSDLIDSDNSGNDSNGSTGGESSSSGSGSTNTDKSKLMVCSRWDIDGSLKITETMNVTIKNDKVTKYEVTYVISSMINGTPKNFSTYYQKMLKKYKQVVKSYVYIADIIDEGDSATLTYTAVLKDYIFEEKTEEELAKYDEEYLEFYKKNIPPYKLEIKKDSTRAEAKKQLEALEWDCD